MWRGIEHLPRQPGHHLDRVRAAHADRARAQPAGVRGVRVGADDQRAREGVVLQHDLVDDAGARAPRSRRRTSPPPSAGSRRPPGSRRATRAGRRSPSTRAWMRWSQWIVVGTATRCAPRLHELQHAGLAEHVLEDHAIGAQRTGSCWPGSSSWCSGSSRWPSRTLSARVSGRPQPAADDGEIALHRRVEPGGRCPPSIRSRPCLAPIGNARR